MLKLVTAHSGIDNIKVYYNPYTVKFTDDPRMYTTHTPLRIRSKSPSVIKIMLGDACNFRCKYCRQDHHNKKEPFNPRKIQDFISMVTDNLDLTHLEKIEYWGGEPLVYWDEINELMMHFECRTEQPITHHVTTNGSLINKQIFSDIMNHRFLFKLSHDGPGQHLRTLDPLLTKGDILMELYESMKNMKHSHFTINSVLTSCCPSPKEIVKWFQVRFGDDVKLTKIEPVIPYNEEALSYTINPRNMTEFSDTIFHDLTTTNIIDNVLEYQALWEMFVRMYNDPHYIYNMSEAKCHANQVRTICTDLKGNITPCQVYDDYTPESVIGHLTQLDKVNELLPTKAFSKENCINCPVISLCRGICPYIDSMEYADANCSIRFATYSGILRAFILKSLKLKVIEFDGEFYNNDRFDITELLDTAPLKNAAVQFKTLSEEIDDQS